MSSTLHADLSRRAGIARRFGARARSYEAHADLQRRIAARLTALLPKLSRPRVLELGCGTGVLSRLLLARYPDGAFCLTDLSADMLDQCRSTLSGQGGGIEFRQMDAEEPAVEGQFDLIAMSMTLHWLADPIGALNKLRRLLSPRGRVVYASLGPGSFPEWRAVLEEQALASGLIDVPPLPGLVEEERLVVDKDPLSFLRRMKAVGGITAKADYQPLSPGALRRAIRLVEKRYAGRITWHISYGRLGPCDASQSRPSSSPA